MNEYWNSYTYENFKLLNSLNLVDEIELNITEGDMLILKTYYNHIELFESVNFKQFINIINKLSVIYYKTPIQIANILYAEQQEKNNK